MTFHSFTKACNYCQTSFDGFPIQNYCSICCRFWSKVDIKGPDDCWEWTASIVNNGYPQFGINGKMRTGHRLSYEFHHGKIPKGLCVCHKCDNKKCVNPHHLIIGTNADNIRDMVEKGRSAKGEANSQAKLTENNVINIRNLLNHKATPKSISVQFKVCKETIYDIKNGRSWKHI